MKPSPLSLAALTCAIALSHAALAQPAPPRQALEDCKGKQAGERVTHTTPEGSMPAVCVDSTNGLVARPERGSNAGAKPSGKPGNDTRREAGGQRQYSLEQALSEHAQLNTIAFNGLAFLTGDFGYDTFLPPGKVSDYFGFQYMRDIDARGGGHNTNFLTRIAFNTLRVLDAAQRARLLALAQTQQDDIRRFAEMRLPLIKAFRINLDGKQPNGTRLDAAAVQKYSGDLYALDGKLSYERAKVMAEVLRSLTPTQKAALGKLKFGDSSTWPDIAEPIDKRSMSHDANVAVMTYASEMFSWYAGSLDADTYFCPERHGMYFGGFGMKTAPAMGKRDYAISTSLTGDSGEAFLAVLNDTQRKAVTELPGLQSRELAEIVRIRRDIASELRRFLKGETADSARIQALSRRYGELDGQLSYLYAHAFAQVGQSLNLRQKQALNALRQNDSSAPKGPFLYSTPITQPRIGDTSAFFSPR